MTDGYAFLRFLHTNYSESDYLNETWNLVSDFVKQALENSSEQHEPISYQAIYCQIYKTACKGYKERIFDDLGTLITEHCQQLKRHFDESQMKWSDARGSHAAMDRYLTQFIQSLDQYHHALDVISPLFHYLEVVYIKPKLYSTVREQLILLLRTIVIEPHINPVFKVLHQLLNTAASPSKETIDLLLRLTNELSPDCAVSERVLFQRYCNGEDVLEEMLVPEPRTSCKRSVDTLPGEEDQPSAKRSMSAIKSPQSDHH